MARTTFEGWYCDLCNKEFDTERGRDFHMARWCPENPDADRPGEANLKSRRAKPTPDVEADFAVDETAPVEPASIFDEAPPAEPAKTPWRERIWGQTGTAKPSAPATSEKKPRKRRTSTEGIWQVGFTTLGTALVRTGADVPVGNCLVFQGPVVGPVMDEAIAGTFVDTLLQPLASSGKRFKAVSDVVSMPVLVGIMERSPGMAPVLEPLLRQVIRQHLVVYARMAKQQRKADAEYRKALDDLGMEDVGEDPVDGIIAQIWSGSPQSQAETNGHVAGADVHP